MDRIKKLVGLNLQSIRKQLKLTLQELSEITGVSKSMLGEIERGVTSPTVTILWKIADGLKIPLTQFLQEETPDFTLIRKSDMQCFEEGESLTISTIFKYDPGKKFEIFHFRMDAKTSHESRGHNKGVGEYVLVYEGVMTIQVGKNRFELSSGDSLFFRGDISHTYSNFSDQTLQAYSIISYEDIPEQSMHTE